MKGLRSAGRAFADEIARVLIGPDETTPAEQPLPILNRKRSVFRQPVALGARLMRRRGAMDGAGAGERELKE